MQLLTQELKKNPTPPANTPTQKRKQQQQQQQAGNPKTPATNKGKEKFFADVTASCGPGPANFTKVTHKKKAAQPCFQPEYTRLNRQLIVETEGEIPEFITNDSILEVVNALTEPQGLKFIAALRNKNDNLRYERNLLTSSDKGSEMIPEITGALNSLNIKATNIFSNSRWSRYIIHCIPTTIGNKNSVELSARIATEIASVTNLSLAQAPRWLSSPDDINLRGSGTIVISLPGKVETLGLSTLYLFIRRCRMEKARPDYRSVQCHKCQKFGHYQETCTGAAACGICADPHLTTDHKCKTTGCQGGIRCSSLPHRCVNCPPGLTNFHKSMDRSCPVRAKLLLTRNTNPPALE